MSKRASILLDIFMLKKCYKSAETLDIKPEISGAAPRNEIFEGASNVNNTSKLMSLLNSAISNPFISLTCYFRLED